MNNIKQKMNENSFAKLKNLNNDALIDFVTKYVELCNPDTVYVCDDSVEDRTYIRNRSIELGEEQKLATEGHTIHFDGPKDQARDKANTRYLVREGVNLGEKLNTKNYQEGYDEVHEYFKNSMVGKQVYVRFFCLGPVNSEFSLSCVQITDSAYVAHSEDLLYRSGYSEFIKLKGRRDFFHFVHSAGPLDKGGHSVNHKLRRIYIDLEKDRVLSINNQYAGNSLGLKKLALRLAIHKANHEDWLTEHMFIMGVHPEGKERTSYFTGAFPSACGKTSTAMIPGQTIVGDDIAYLRVWDDGSCHAVNIESGIFGIITDVNPIDDPLIYDCLTTPRELIFSNVLVNNGKPFWLGMGQELPSSGINHWGRYQKGMKDEDGNEIPPAHKNARYTIRIDELDNVDPEIHNPDGVRIDGIIYGGRDSDTNVPICQSLDWDHGVFLGACLESETTAATLGREGVRKHSPMANLDFVVVPLHQYIHNHLEYGKYSHHGIYVLR